MGNIELRDYLAGQALTDIIDMHRDDLDAEVQQVRASAARRVASLAYEVADAMLAHRATTAPQRAQVKGAYSKASKALKKR